MLIRPLPNIVTLGSISANDEPPCIAVLVQVPYHLSIVSTNLPRGTGIGYIVIIKLLSNPQVNRINTTECATTTFCKVFTVGSTRMYKVAVTDPLVCVSLGVQCQCVVPYHRCKCGWTNHLTSKSVVGINVILWCIVGVWGVNLDFTKQIRASEILQNSIFQIVDEQG